MAAIDAQGRVFGRVNLVDALLAALLLAALPAGYGAARLFREPQPMLKEVRPSTFSQGAAQQVEILGERLRPYLRVSFGSAQGPAFVYAGPDRAFVPLPPLEPGTYDVVLYDYMREVSRLPGALTITAPPRPPTVRFRVAGAFTGLTPEMAGRLEVGLPMSEASGLLAGIETLGTPRPAVARVRVSDTDTVTVPLRGLQEVPATVIVTCTTIVDAAGVLRCAMGSLTLAPDVNLVLEAPGVRFGFRIDRVGEALADPTESNR